MQTLNKDTTYYIWDVRWLCRIKQIDLYSIEELQVYGVHTVGDPVVDRTLANQKITTYRTIDNMVEYHRQGIPIWLVNPTDAKSIYHHIENHLQAWVINLRQGLNIGDAPIEDLIDMNDFANTIFPHARNSFEQETVSSSFMRAINQLGFTKQPFNTGRDTSLNRRPAVRNDLSDIFKTASLSLNRR